MVVWWVDFGFYKIKLSQHSKFSFSWSWQWYHNFLFFSRIRHLVQLFCQLRLLTNFCTIPRPATFLWSRNTSVWCYVIHNIDIYRILIQLSNSYSSSHVSTSHAVLWKRGVGIMISTWTNFICFRFETKTNQIAHKGSLMGGTEKLTAFGTYRHTDRQRFIQRWYTSKNFSQNVAYF